MRLWSLHPRYLDRPGLTAAWREALLAQAVLAGRTRGYTRHPQLARFRETADPLAAIGAYLDGIRAEATERGYRFDVTRINRAADGGPGGMADASWVGAVPVSDGQLAFEWAHLMAKLRVRSPESAARWSGLPPKTVEAHPLFRTVPGPVADWERAAPAG